MCAEKRVSVRTEADDAEEYSKDAEAGKLDRLASNGVDGGDGDPVSWNRTSTDKDDVANTDPPKHLVDRVALGVADGGKDGRVVQADSVVGHVEEEPGGRRTDEHLAVPPLAVVRAEVTEGCLGDLELGSTLAHHLDTVDLVWDTFRLAAEVGLDIGAGLDDVARHIECVAGSLRDRQAVVESNAARYSTEADDHTPHLVDCLAADTVAVGVRLRGKQRLLEASSDNERDDTGSELTNTLHGEDGTHHGTTPLGRCELCSDDGRERVVCRID